MKRGEYTMAIDQIIKGHINELLKKEKELYEYRINICKYCPLYKRDNILGYVCNPDLYLNPKTGETSEDNLPNFYNGCGCRLEASTRVKEKRCPVGKW